jgi:hypothetical protein
VEREPRLELVLREVVVRAERAEPRVRPVLVRPLLRELLVLPVERVPAGCAAMPQVSQ